MTIGWSNGIALQLSLPSRFIALPSVTQEWRDRDGSPERMTAAQNAVEQVGGDGTIGERRDRCAGFGQTRHKPARRAPDRRFGRPPPICRSPELATAATEKCMSAKPPPLNCAESPRIGSGVIGLHVQVRRHSGHGVDLAAELRHEEAVHDPGGGQLEVDRGRDRDGQLIDARDAEFGVDEQPFPVERNDLNGDWPGLGGDWLARIEVMRSDPGDAADQQHCHRGNRPNQQLKTAGVAKSGR